MGDYSRLHGGRVEYHPDHPEYIDTDDYYYEQVESAQEAAETQYCQERDQEDALVIDQLANVGLPTDDRAAVYERPERTAWTVTTTGLSGTMRTWPWPRRSWTL